APSRRTAVLTRRVRDGADESVVEPAPLTHRAIIEGPRIVDARAAHVQLDAEHAGHVHLCGAIERADRPDANGHHRVTSPVMSRIAVPARMAATAAPTSAFTGHRRGGTAGRRRYGCVRA